MSNPPSARPPGRPPASTAEKVEESSLQLMVERGFDRVSVTDLAAAADISRATFFRYFPTKSDLVWRGFDRSLDRMEQVLTGMPAERDTMAAIRAAIQESMRAVAADPDLWWTRFMRINSDCYLGGETFDRWNRWSDLMTRFVAARMGVPESHPIALAIAWAHQGVFTATLRAWDGSPMDLDQFLAELLPSIELVGSQMAPLLDAAGSGGGEPAL